MAVTIFKSPPAVVGVYNSIEWILKISDIGVPNTTVKKIGYYLADESGTPLTEMESIRSPVANMEIPLNFTLDCRGLVRTMIPENNLAAPIEDEYFSKIIKLVYGEIVTDLVECETVVTVETESDEVTILNNALQTYEYREDYFNTPRILSHVPDRHNMLTTSTFYLWVWDVASVTITPSSGSAIVHTTTADVSVVPLSPTQFINWQTLTYIDVTVAGIRTFRINLSPPDCDAGSFGSDRTIMYLDSLGGRYAMSFETFDNYSMQSDYDVISKTERFTISPTFEGDNAQLYNTGGETVINKRNRDTITLITTTALTDTTPLTVDYVREWYKAFLASPAHHIYVQHGGDFAGWHKFIIESGTVNYRDEVGQIDMVITGYISPTYRTQTIDR